MKNFSATQRSQYLGDLLNQSFDLVIIGGGITGAGVARDAASRGMKVALVEAQDFAEGTSSRSSKLIHGGIRYLENLEFDLVYEALSERNKLFEIAPHLVHPLRFLLPTYEGGRVPHWQFRLGMWIYDILALFQAPEMHEYLTKDKILQDFSFIKEKGLEGGFLYSDAYMDDDRLTIETLRSANDLGAVCVSHIKALSYDKNRNGISLLCEDQFPEGLAGIGQKDKNQFVINAKHIISAVGPWTDILGQSFYKDKWSPIMRPSKGIHLSFSQERVPLKKAIVMGAEERIVFAIPRNDMVIVGTTDTDFDHDPGQVHSTREDVNYVLGVINDYFPGLKIDISDVISSYSGIRPLVDDGSSSEGKTSREHVVFRPFKEITCVAGGKYTTYRKMAAEVVNEALQSFSCGDQVEFKNSDTYKLLNPKVSKESFLACDMNKISWSKEFSLPLEAVEHFISRYGFEAYDLLKISMDYLNLAWPTRIWATEADFAIDNTMCYGLIDFYIRRTPLFLSRKDHGFEFLNEIMTVFSTKLGWSDLEQVIQKNALHQHLNAEMGWMK